MPMPIPAWTFSQLETFATCPKKFYHLKVARDVEDPPSIHTEWGKRVHSALEYRLKDGTPLPEGMTQWEPLMRKIAALPGTKFTEIQFAVDADFRPAPWERAWSRGIADVVIVHKDRAAVLDHKTGRRKPSDQLELYAAYVFSHFPHVNECTNTFVWLKEKKLDRDVIRRDDAERVHDKFRERAKRLESAYERDAWPAKPSGLCREWCPVKTCQFNGQHNKR